jgi:hypothetical protein
MIVDLRNEDAPVCGDLYFSNDAHCVKYRQLYGGLYLKKT